MMNMLSSYVNIPNLYWCAIHFELMGESACELRLEQLWQVQLKRKN